VWAATFFDDLPGSGFAGFLQAFNGVAPPQAGLAGQRSAERLATQQGESRQLGITLAGRADAGGGHILDQSRLEQIAEPFEKAE